MAQTVPLPEVGTLYASNNVRTGGEKYYVTTAINYTNGVPHIGHAYEALMADVVARYNRAYGREVFFLTGTDEHGQKIAKSAEEKNMTPKELCDHYVAEFQRLNTRMSISNDDYIRTTDPYHEDTARELWKRCAANKNAAGEPDIYLGRYDGWYDPREEKFLTETDAKKADYKDAYGVELKKVSESCYFFRLSAYRERLIEHYTANPEAISPADRRTEVMSMLEGEVPDLCVSRTTFDWGVKLPEGFEEGHVMYVWFDALTNYVSATQLLLPEADPARTKLWPADCHIVGKDITRFHCIYWPAMLWSAGLELPKKVSGHGFVQAADGSKMSKSVGNVVNPHDLLDKFPADTVRFYCCNAAHYGADMKCSEEALLADHNVLADQIGNLAQRAVKLAELYGGGKVPARPAVALPAPYDTKPVFKISELRDTVDKLMQAIDIKAALIEIQSAYQAANAFITDTEPFKMKAEDQIPTRTLIVRICLELVYAIAHFVAPYLPVTSTHIFNKIAPGVTTCELKDDFTNLTDGTVIKSGPWAEGLDVLFPKTAKPEETPAKGAKDAKAAKGGDAKKDAKEKKPAKADKGAKDKAPAAKEVKPDFDASGWRLAMKSEVAQRWYLQEFGDKKYPEVSGVLTLSADGIFDEAIYSVGEEGKSAVHTASGPRDVILQRTGGIKYDPKTGLALLKVHHSTNRAELEANPSVEIKISQKGAMSLSNDSETTIWGRKRQL